MSDRPWTTRDMPDGTGRTALVTGANTGLGFAIALGLARSGADVVLACRNEVKASTAAAQIRDAAPRVAVTTLALDLSSLAAVRESAEVLHREHDRLDLLVNNAGGFQRHRSLSLDGLESTMAVNHFGPFAFTGLALELLTATSGSRVVVVGSNGHRGAIIDWGAIAPKDDPSSPTPRYSFIRAYKQAKLANLLFAFALQRRLESAGVPTIAVAGHPGLARTDGGREMNPLVRAIVSPRLRALTSWTMQSPEQAARPLLRAATDPQAHGGEYFGPSGFRQNVGAPIQVEPSAQTHDVALQDRLWAESERLTGVHYLAP